MSFYKRNGEELMVAPNFVHAPDYSLTAETKDEHTYPVDGWYWFDTLDAAMDGMRTVTDVQSVTIRQACIQLELDGLLDDVEALVATLPKVYQIEWQRAGTVLRDNPLVEMVRQQKEMTHAQIDELFNKASKI